MSKAKHTSGPWLIDNSTDSVNGLDLDAIGVVQKDGDQWHVAAVWTDLPDVKEAAANAQLISCAPEMLEMIVKVQSFIAANRGKNYMVELLRREIDGLDGLITKATTI